MDWRHGVRSPAVQGEVRSVSQKRDPLVTGKNYQQKVHAMSIHQSTLILFPTKKLWKKNMASFWKKIHITNVFCSISKAFCCLKPFGTADLELPQLGVHRKSSASRIGDDSENPKANHRLDDKSPYEINYQAQQVTVAGFYFPSTKKISHSFQQWTLKNNICRQKKVKLPFFFPGKERRNSVNYAKDCPLNCWSVVLLKNSKSYRKNTKNWQFLVNLKS